MTQAPAQASFNGSRLVRFLSDLAVTQTPAADHDLSQNLGQLIDFSSSVTLSDTLNKLSKLTFETHDVPAQASQEEFLRVRGLLVEAIIKSFLPADDNRVKIRYPTPKPGTSLNDPGAYEPYRRFYTAQQREIDLKVQYIQSFVRDAASGLSPRLAQLVELDTATGDILAMHQRKCFAVVPVLLEKRFKQLFPPNSTTAPDTNTLEQDRLLPTQDEQNTTAVKSPKQEQFAREIQGLLLAELDVRFQPVTGLIEAINEEVGH